MRVIYSQKPLRLSTLEGGKPRRQVRPMRLDKKRRTLLPPDTTSFLIDGQISKIRPHSKE